MTTAGSTYAAPPFSVAVDSLTTNTPSPAISGTVSDTAATLSVRVNGNWYGVGDNNGVWTLPAGEIPPLPNGSYNVTVCGVDGEGLVAFNSTENELGALTVDIVSPPVASLPIVGPQSAAIGSLGITFSEPVSGFSEQYLQLKLNGISLPLGGTTLTTSDDENWTLGNLSEITAAPGTYSLSVSAAGWGITDSAGNVLSTNAATAWTEGVAYPIVESIDTVGANLTNATSVQYAVTFSENVTNVRAADFTLASDGAAGTIASVSGSGSTYTVTVNNVSGNGTLGLDLVDNDSITDSSGNPLGGVGSGNGNFTGELYTINTLAPSISIGSPSLPYTTSGPVTYTVTYSDANGVFNASNLTVADITLNETGSANGTISSVTGSGLIYTVTIGSISGNGTLGISIAAGTASDTNGNLAPTAGPSVTFIVAGPGPSVATPASAAPSLVTGTTVQLSVSGADAYLGASSLTYYWTATTVPAGAAPLNFSANGTNAAQNSTATVSMAGDYTFQVTITDTSNLTITSSVNVTVDQTLTSITVSPSFASLNAGAARQFTATGYDQFGNALTTQPNFAWTTGVAGGQINSSSGLFAAPNTTDIGTVTVAAGLLSGYGLVIVTDHRRRWPRPPAPRSAQRRSRRRRLRRWGRTSTPDQAA